MISERPEVNTILSVVVCRPKLTLPVILVVSESIASIDVLEGICLHGTFSHFLILFSDLDSAFFFGLVF